MYLLEHLYRQLSASSVRETCNAEFGQKLDRRIRENSFNTDSFSKTLRVRKASLDHRQGSGHVILFAEKCYELFSSIGVIKIYIEGTHSGIE